MRTQLICLAAALTAVSGPAWADLDWSKVEEAFGRKAATQGEVRRFGFPRTDLKVTVDGIAIRPAFALGSWVAFHPMGDEAMAMGDLVLTHDEVNPVMKRLVEGGVEVTALHNHLLRASPSVMYMHISAKGEPVEIAHAIRAALQVSKTPVEPQPAGQDAAEPDLKFADIEKAIGRKGKVSDGVLQFSIPRAETIREAGMELPPAMGLGIAINFQSTGGGKAAITGDFVLTAEEVNPVLRTLREAGVEVAALHNHMLTEEPRLFFMHFWANDDAVKLATGLRAALAKTNAQRS